MTIATVMGTSLIFLSVGWTGKSYEPLVLVVGGMICIAAANAGATSQDLKKRIYCWCHPATSRSHYLSAQ